ncbi:Rrf2 family transcriptional regulator [Aestuariivirga sp.]|uniref:RrF2 family transcriptional regulator n=1 Tax=Aestuariivirga sp. TaxID=2650926 RepID=UPI0035935226
MLSSSRFIVAVHAMSVLARFTGKGPVCSALVAESVHTNPVVIRRLMTELEKVNLVRSVAGRSGGFELNRDAGEITLADVYFAVEDENVFRMHKTDPHSQCPVAAQLGKILSPPLRAAECALHSSLAKTSIRDVATAIV